MRKEKQNLRLNFADLPVAVRKVEIPSTQNVSYDYPNKIRKWGNTLAASAIEIVTAVATAASAVLLLIQVIFAKAQSAPFIQARQWLVEGEVACYYVLIHPADTPLQINAISVKHALIGPAKFAHDRAGNYVPDFKKIPIAGRLQVSIAVPPRKVSDDAVREYVLIKTLNSASAITISLHSRIWFLPTRYKITVMVNSDA